MALTDRDLLEQAIAASGLSARQFALQVCAVDDRTVRRWLAGEVELQGTARQLCRAVIAHPRIVRTLAREE